MVSQIIAWANFLLSAEVCFLRNAADKLQNGLITLFVYLRTRQDMARRSTPPVKNTPKRFILLISCPQFPDSLSVPCDHDKERQFRTCHGLQVV